MEIAKALSLDARVIVMDEPTAALSAAEVGRQIASAQGQTFTAGKLGKFTVGADSTILLGPPLLFNAANIDKYHF